MAQPDATFMKAFDTVRRRYSLEEWLFASPHQVTQEIYGEMRRLDLIRAEKMLLRSANKKKRTASNLVPLDTDAVEQNDARRPPRMLRARAA